MARLPVVGEVSYNGVTFPSSLQSRVTITPIYATDGRTVKYRRYRVTIECVFTEQEFTTGGINNSIVTMSDGASIDNAMSVVRNRLLIPGKTLKFLSQGLGADLTISGINDMDFGPKPEVLDWEPIGSNKACRVVWTCSATITDCESGASSLTAVWGEFTYGVTWAIAENGLTVRTISGTVETRVNRVGDSAISSTADLLRSYLRFPVPEGFLRSQNYALSPDKRVLHFTITDSEVDSDNAYPPHTVQISVRERVSGGLTDPSGHGFSGGAVWSYSLMGSCVVAPGVSKGIAWRAFATIIRQRINWAIEHSVSPPGTEGKRFPGPMMIYNIDLGGEIFGRQVEFSITWLLLTSLESLVNATGLWSPMDVGSWSDWNKSLEENQSQRGLARMGHVAGDDVIVNFCNNQQPTRINAVSYSTPDIKKPVPLFLTTCPPEKGSWVEYRPFITVERRTNTTMQKFLGGADADKPINPSSKDLLDNKSSQSGKSSLDLLQERSVSDYYVTLTGWAVRVGYKIEAPSIISIGGQHATLVDESVPQNFIIGYSGKCPIYRLEWRRRYHIKAGDGTRPITTIPEEFKDRLQ